MFKTRSQLQTAKDSDLAHYRPMILSHITCTDTVYLRNMDV